MAEQSETYVKTDPHTGEKSERVVYSAADRVAAKFAGYLPTTTKTTKAAKTAAAPAEDGDKTAADSK